MNPVRTPTPTPSPSETSASLGLDIGSAEDHRSAEKALRVNLDARHYGTFAEIGGGQEVARWFFRVGGSSGTVAKTMSAYDMQFSDAIYGKGTRYVSRQRLMAMLDHEFQLLEERLKQTRGDKTSFFVFADTVAARNFNGTNECHGWLGLRFQAAPHAPANDLLIHVNLLDKTLLLQQQALGILGVNLLHSAFYERASLEGMLKSLFDSLSLSRVEINFVEARGPEFEGLEADALNFTLLRLQLCRSIAFDAEGKPTITSELLHHRAVVLQRGSFQFQKEKFQQMMRDSEAALAREVQKLEKPPQGLFEISINSARPDDTPDDEELRRRVAALTHLGYPVLVSNFIENFRLTEYLRRYTVEPIRFTIGVGTLVQILRDSFYTNVDGGLLEGLGKLLGQGVKVFAFPMTAQDFSRQLSLYSSGQEFCAVPTEGLVTAKNIAMYGPVRHLYSYLLESGYVIPIPNA
jgi:hypothetical protein